MSTTTDAWGIPDFGRTISRRSLLNHYRHARPELTLICAPSGFGKSVLAAEIASCDLFDRGIWIGALGQPMTLEDVAERLDGSTAPAADDELDTSTSGLAVAVLPRQMEGATGAAADRLRRRLTDLEGERICLVLDDVVLQEDLSHLCELLALVRDLSSWESRVVVTSRELGDFDPLSIQCPHWIADANDLRLDTEECSLIAELMTGERLSSQAAEALREACSGQAATVSVVVGQRGLIVSLETEGCLPESSIYLSKHVEQLTLKALDAAARECLYAAALFGAGSAAELDRVVPGSAELLAVLADRVPLLRVGQDSDGRVTFYAHDVLLSAVTSKRYVELLGDRAGSLRRAAIASLDALGRQERAFGLLSGEGHTHELIAWLEARGPELVEHGKFQLLSRALDRIPANRMVGSTRLLLTKALLCRHADNLDDALRCATAAQRIAENVGEDRSAYVEAALVLARVYMDTGRFSDLPGLLEPLFEQEGLDPAARCLTHGYLVGAYSYLAELSAAQSHMASVERLARNNQVPAYVTVWSLMCVALVRTLVLGMHSRGAHLLLELCRFKGVPEATQLQAEGNLATVFVELGRLDRAAELLGGMLTRCREIGGQALDAYFTNSIAAVWAAIGDERAADEAYERSERMLVRMGDDYGAAIAGFSFCAALRSRGKLPDATARIEESIAFLERRGLKTLLAHARLEWAACKLALGDSEVACETAQSILDDPQLTEALGHRLKADLIIAEAERAAGRFDAAAERMAAHADYILTESANWQLGMNIRAFPGLLGILARAIGPARIPAHLLAIVLPEHAERALRAAADHLIADEWQVLSRRLLPEDRAAALEREVRGTPVVRVRMLGGFEVVTPSGTVADRQWRKRKARLLFAMLVSKQGRAVPRDVLIEWLWPDMDDERGRNNFYVTWSTMRRALSAGGTDSVSPECVDNTNSICRIATNLVRSDLDDFDEALRDFRNAASAKHADGVRNACDRLVDIYRGELLPGDLYEDCFVDQRSRYRHGLCDALLAGARLLDSAGDRDHAASLMRAALSVDPWREDLYQAAMQLQIALGQRSGAIETFMACRSKLCEDLGIDPSRETQQLYQAILAMEEPP